MSRKILKSISMDLSTKSINNAIMEIREFKRQLMETCKELKKVLAEEGAEIAKMQVASMEAVDTGLLEHSIHGIYDPSTGNGIVYVDKSCPYAIYVEYGTGIVGAGDPHPEAAEVGWAYDVNQHGIKGWVYKSDKDGKYHWTQGYFSRPFMYNTLRWLEEAAPQRMSGMLDQM